MRILALPLVVAAVSAAASLQGCSITGPEDTASEGSGHTVGQLTNLNDPHVWAQASDADYAKVLQIPPIPLADPVAVRMQQWLERYHGIVGQVLAERGETLVAPKPVPGVVRQRGPNAWVSSAVACPTWAVSRALAAPAVDAPLGAAAPAQPDIVLSPMSAFSTDMTARCVQPVNWTSPSAFASFWNKQAPACSLSTGPNGDLVIGGDACVQGGTAATGTFATIAVASTIGITMDAITWGDEIRVAMTLAHELGHYFRAHSNPAVVKSIGFFYTDDNDNPTTPLPIAQSKQLEGVVRAIKALPQPIRITVPTKFNKHLGQLVVGLRGACPGVTLADETLRAVFTGLANADEQAQYVTFESAIDTCAKGLSLGNPQIKTAFDKYLMNARLNPAVVGDAADISAALAAMTVKFDQVDAADKQITQQMTDGTLGWYTDEQEADEIGLELATRAGFDVKALIDSRMKTNEQTEAMTKSFGLPLTSLVDTATCKKWLAADFMETGPDGVARRIKVPAGSLADPHHEDCYRIYNLWREAKKHNYVPAAAPPAFSPSWETIQAHALELGGTQPPAL